MLSAEEARLIGQLVERGVRAIDIIRFILSVAHSSMNLGEHSL